MDPFHDDQGIAVKVKGRGLVVIGGCSHSGIINTVKHVQKVARTSKVHAVLGGFHLTGKIFEPIIGPTIEEIKKIGARASTSTMVSSIIIQKPRNVAGFTSGSMNHSLHNTRALS